MLKFLTNLADRYFIEPRLTPEVDAYNSLHKLGQSLTTRANDHAAQHGYLVLAHGHVQTRPQA